MKIAKRSANNSDYAPDPSNGITAENYAVRSSAFMKGRGGNGFVIRAIEGMDGALATKQPATEAQWISWMYYLGWRGIPHRYAKWRGMTTVPAEWPEEFDGDALASDRSARLPSLPPMVSPAKKADIARKSRALAASLAIHDHRKKRTDVGAMSAVEAERHLDELQAKFTSGTCPCPPLGSGQIA